MTAFNPAAKGANIVLSNTDRTATAGVASWESVLSLMSQSSYRFYFEVSVDAQGTPADSIVVGINDNAQSTADFVGNANDGWGFRRDGTLHGPEGVKSGFATYGTGDVVGVAVDLLMKKVWFAVNGTWIIGDPATGKRPAFDNVIFGDIFPVASVHTDAAVTLSEATGEFAQTPPTGFDPWSNASYSTAFGYKVDGKTRRLSDSAPLTRYVHVVRSDTGELLNSAISDINTDGFYEVPIDYAEPVHAYVVNHYGNPWLGNSDYKLGEYVIPNLPNGHWYKVTVEGTTGTTEPTWPTDTSTVVSGTVTFQDMGEMDPPAIKGPYAPEEIV